jgi:HEAT repeat protein
MLALTLAAWFVVRIQPREPFYAGQALSYWLTQLGPKSISGPYSWLVTQDKAEATEKTKQAEVAINAMGVDVIPFLLDKVRREHGLRERLYATVWPNLPRALRQRLSPPRQFRNYGNPHGQIVRALGTLESSAVPALITALRDHNCEVQITSMAALCGFESAADAAIPSLLKLTKHSNGFVRRWSVFSLGRMGPGRTNAVPNLIAALKDSDVSPLPGSSARVRETAAEVLGQLGPQAHAACSELKKLLADPDAGVRREAAIALWRIASDREVLPILITELKGNEDAKQLIAVLGEMGPIAKPAVPAIKEALGPSWLRAGRLAPARRGAVASTNHETTMATLEEVASYALRKIDPDLEDELSSTSFLETAPLSLGGGSGFRYAVMGGNHGSWEALGPEAAPALVQVLDDRNPNTRIEALLTLGRIDWKPTPASTAKLTRLLDDRGAFKFRGLEDKESGREFVCIGDLAAEMLGGMGTEARSALPALRKLLTDSYWSSRPYPLSAVWRIDHDTNILQYLVPNLTTAGTAGAYNRFLAVATEMGAAAKPAIPAILTGMTNVVGDLSGPVREALRKIDPDSAATPRPQVE